MPENIENTSVTPSTPSESLNPSDRSVALNSVDKGFALNDAVGITSSTPKVLNSVDAVGIKGDCRNENIDFVKALIAITLVSILVSIWSRVVINFTSYTLGFGEHNTWAFAMVALVLTVILIIYVLIILDTETSKSVRATLVGAGIVGGNAGAQVNVNSGDSSGIAFTPDI